MTFEEKLKYMKLLGKGDKIVIADNRPNINFSNSMTQYLGNILEIERVILNYYGKIVFKCKETSFWDFVPAQGHLNLDATINLHQKSKKQSLKTELLTVGRVVETRDRTLGYVLSDRIIYSDCHDPLSSLGNDLLSNMHSSGDIISVFDAPLLDDTVVDKRAFSLSHGKDKSIKLGLLVPIWERDETPHEVQELMCQIEQKEKQIKFAQKEKECLEEEKQELEKELQKLKK